MATTHYNFPTITGTDTIDGVNAINGLANAVDAALYGVAGDMPEQYELPIAGTTSLGGVRGAGDISVNPATGDMSINNNTVTGAMVQDASIPGAKIATGGINSAQLNQSILTNISQGVSAYTENHSSPRLYRFPDVSPKENMTSGAIYSTYTVSDACNLVTIKVALNNCAFNFSGGNTSADEPLVTIGTIPTQYRPTTNFDTILFVVSAAGGGACLLNASVSSSGKVGVFHTNYNIGQIPNTSDVYANAVICYYYGTVAQS